MESDNGYDNFCKVAGYKADSLWGTLEFALYLGFKSINLWALGYPHMDDKAPEETLDKVRAFEGPNGPTMIKAYMARRFSWRGRLSAAWRKPLYAAGLVILLVLCLGRSTFNERGMTGG